MSEDRCPCDSCRFKTDNLSATKYCPNKDYFFDAMRKAWDGILKTEPCDSYESIP